MKMLLRRAIIFIRNEVILMSCSRRSSSSIDGKKLAGFNKAAANWWDPKESAMKQLHVVNPHHVAFVRDQLGPKDGTRPEPHRPLTGYKMADVGCGVGMNSEGLALLGAEVTGMDPGDMLIHEAKVHAASNPDLEDKLKYLVSTAEDHALTHRGQYDAVLAFYVLEHIRNRQEFIDSCLALLKPNGSLFVAHGNRSLMWFSNMLWQKYVTGLISKSLLMPYTTFLTTREIIAMVNKGHLCELKRQKNMYLTLNGQSARETNWKGFLTYSHFVRKD